MGASAGLICAATPAGGPTYLAHDCFNRCSCGAKFVLPLSRMFRLLSVKSVCTHRWALVRRVGRACDRTHRHAVRRALHVLCGVHGTYGCIVCMRYDMTQMRGGAVADCEVP